MPSDPITSGGSHSDVLKSESNHIDLLTSKSNHSDILELTSNNSGVFKSESSYKDVFNSERHHADVFKSESNHSDVFKSESNHSDVFLSGSSYNDVFSSGSHHADVFMSGSSYDDGTNSGSNQADVLMSGSSHSDVFMSGSRYSSVFNSGNHQADVFKSDSNLSDVFVSGRSYNDEFKSGSHPADVFKSESSHSDLFMSGSHCGDEFSSGSHHAGVFKSESSRSNVFMSESCYNNVFNSESNDSHVCKSKRSHIDVFKSVSNHTDVLNSCSSHSELFKSANNHTEFNQSTDFKMLIEYPDDVFGNDHLAEYQGKHSADLKHSKNLKFLSDHSTTAESWLGNFKSSDSARFSSSNDMYVSVSESNNESMLISSLSLPNTDDKKRILLPQWKNSDKTCSSCIPLDSDAVSTPSNNDDNNCMASAENTEIRSNSKNYFQAEKERFKHSQRFDLSRMSAVDSSTNSHLTNNINPPAEEFKNSYPSGRTESHKLLFRKISQSVNPVFKCDENHKSQSGLKSTCVVANPVTTSVSQWADQLSASQHRIDARGQSLEDNQHCEPISEDVTDINSLYKSSPSSDVVSVSCKPNVDEDRVNPDRSSVKDLHNAGIAAVFSGSVESQFDLFFSPGYSISGDKLTSDISQADEINDFDSVVSENVGAGLSLSELCANSEKTHIITFSNHNKRKMIKSTKVKKCWTVETDAEGKLNDNDTGDEHRNASSCDSSTSSGYVLTQNSCQNRSDQNIHQSSLSVIDNKTYTSGRSTVDYGIILEHGNVKHQGISLSIWDDESQPCNVPSATQKMWVNTYSQNGKCFISHPRCLSLDTDVSSNKQNEKFCSEERTPKYLKNRVLCSDEGAMCTAVLELNKKQTVHGSNFPLRAVFGMSDTFLPATQISGFNSSLCKQMISYDDFSILAHKLAQISIDSALDELLVELMYDGSVEDVRHLSLDHIPPLLPYPIELHTCIGKVGNNQDTDSSTAALKVTGINATTIFEFPSDLTTAEKTFVSQSHSTVSNADNYKPSAGNTLLYNYPKDGVGDCSNRQSANLETNINYCEQPFLGYPNVNEQRHYSELLQHVAWSKPTFRSGTSSPQNVTSLNNETEINLKDVAGSRKKVVNEFLSYNGREKYNKDPVDALSSNDKRILAFCSPKNKQLYEIKSQNIFSTYDRLMPSIDQLGEIYVPVTDSSIKKRQKSKYSLFWKTDEGRFHSRFFKSAKAKTPERYRIKPYSLRPSEQSMQFGIYIWSTNSCSPVSTTISNSMVAGKMPVVITEENANTHFDRGKQNKKDGITINSYSKEKSIKRKKSVKNSNQKCPLFKKKSKQAMCPKDSYNSNTKEITQTFLRKVDCTDEDKVMTDKIIKRLVPLVISDCANDLITSVCADVSEYRKVDIFTKRSPQMCSCDENLTMKDRHACVFRKISTSCKQDENINFTCLLEHCEKAAESTLQKSCVRKVPKDEHYPLTTTSLSCVESQGHEKKVPEKAKLDLQTELMYNQSKFLNFDSDLDCLHWHNQTRQEAATFEHHPIQKKHTSNEELQILSSQKGRDKKIGIHDLSAACTRNIWNKGKFEELMQKAKSVEMETHTNKKSSQPITLSGEDPDVSFTSLQKNSLSKKEYGDDRRSFTPGVRISNGYNPYSSEYNIHYSDSRSRSYLARNCTDDDVDYSDSLFLPQAHNNNVVISKDTRCKLDNSNIYAHQGVTSHSIKSANETEFGHFSQSIHKLQCPSELINDPYRNGNSHRWNGRLLLKEAEPHNLSVFTNGKENDSLCPFELVPETEKKRYRLLIEPKLYTVSSTKSHVPDLADTCIQADNTSGEKQWYFNQTVSPSHTQGRYARQYYSRRIQCSLCKKV